ncbi:hypothetical protein [Sinomicrobium weinanense]|uniref:Lipoprotein n=1 Tax=Sinomicrobium weinanense TaxID=2842200 RepID=A0A926JQJ2_9FLAO|nr:hypothetical protein [Sinomicrobium weinanense]MBC9795462.1 hypothetical protein [Sinomicrobium weinanense]MBU3123987.1 hypothetical protein [Sinomicrobium weinanense]
MKKLLIPTLAAMSFLLACKNNTKEKEQNEESVQTESQAPAPPATTNLCFLTTGKDIERGDRVIRDSTILTLQLKGEKVSGIFNWFPAEKDGRSGTIDGILKDDMISGKYTFTQEGMTETQDIRIEITEQEARITTNPGKQGEFLLTAEKTVCKD